MSRAKAQRLISEVLTLYEGDPATAVQAVLALLAGGHALLIPGREHALDLANAVGWAFNGVIHRFGAEEAFRFQKRGKRRQLPHVILIEDLNTERLREFRKVLTRASLEADPGMEEPCFILATTSPSALPRLDDPARPLWDEMFTIVLQEQLEESLEKLSSSLEPDMLGSGQLLPEDISDLRRRIKQVWMPQDLQIALQGLPDLLEQAGWPGVSSYAILELARVAKVVAYLRGKTKVNYSHVADGLHAVLSSRLLTEGEMEDRLQELIEDLWDRAVGRALPDSAAVPQRRTFVGTTGDLEKRGGQAGLGDHHRWAAPRGQASGEASSERARKAYRPLRDESSQEPDQEEAVSANTDLLMPEPVIHEAYYDEVSYQTREEELTDEEKDSSSFAPPRRSLPPWLRSVGKKGVGLAVIVAIVVAFTLLFPRWPTTMTGVGYLGRAEWELWNDRYQEAQRLARDAGELLGSSDVQLAGWREKISFAATAALRADRRKKQEKAARDAFLTKDYELAATLYKELAEEYPDHNEYHQFTKDARKRRWVHSKVKLILEQADLALEEGRMEDVQELYRRGLLLAPDHPELLERVKQGDQ